MKLPIRTAAACLPLVLVLGACQGTPTADEQPTAPLQADPVEPVVEPEPLFDTAAILAPRFEYLDVAATERASLRGLSVPSPDVIWASGSGGCVVRSVDGGASFERVGPQEAVAENLDLRMLWAFDSQTAWAGSSGLGSASRLYRTEDGGATWTTMLRNEHPDGFWDALAFWDAQHGILVGDPTDGALTVLTTKDGGTSWQRVPAAALPEPARLEALPVAGDPPTEPPAEGLPPEGLDEYCFAASNGSIALNGRSTAWVGTGGAAARVLRTPDRGRSWTVAETPLRSGDAAAGVFGLVFRDANFGIAVGGKYDQPDAALSTAAITEDGGRTWRPADLGPGGYRSGLATSRVHDDLWIAVGSSGASASNDERGGIWRDHADEDQPRLNAVAIDGLARNAWAVGAQGTIARLALPSTLIIWE